jgi:hypothetical protein
MTGIVLDYYKEEMWWYDCVLPLRPKGGLSAADFDAMEDSFYIETEDELFCKDWLDSYATHILDAKYEYTEVRDVVEGLTHLTTKQKADLLEILNDNEKMFDGTLGVYPHHKIHIELEDGAVPKHSRPYPVPMIHLSTFKKELDHLVKIGILAPQGESEWASPSFITPKKDGRVR